MSENKANAALISEHEAKDYLYNIAWSEEDQAYIGRVAEFPSLAAHGDSPENALKEIVTVVQEALLDLKDYGDPIPEPFSKRQYSGRLNLRMPESLHRTLTIEAEQEGVSLNQWINTKLASPLK